MTIPIVVRVSKAKKLFDVPDERKVNKIVIPNLGGISIFIGISVATLLCLGHLYFPEFQYILVGMIILFFIGIKDDILVLPPRKKFIAQLISALIIIVAGNIRFTNLHGVMGIYEINYVMSLCISLVAIVGIINAINLIDGIDGLASGMGILISAIFGIIFFYMNYLSYSILCFSISGSLTMFSIFNVFGKVNKIFMGDTGSLVLGLLTAVFVIKFNEVTITSSELVRNFSPALSMAIISVPFFDMIRVFFIRILQKKSPLFPDMNHIHHKLLRFGFTHFKSTLILLIVNMLLIGLVFFTLSFNINIQLIILVSVSIFLNVVPDIIILRNNQKVNTITQKQFSNFIFETYNDLSKPKFSKQEYSNLNFHPAERLKVKKSERAVV
jgi:UDP-GlcNAc:undecaprenyl-phosphate/decaprenyl-phosphate GlcNAc-1-phosphate transferase